MKKLVTIVLALMMLLSFVACGTVNDNKGDSNTPANQQETGTPDNQGTNDGGSSQGNNGTAEGAKLTGKINLIDLDDRDPSILRGVRINGLNVGTADGFNGRASSLTDVRCIFELGEWIEFYPDTNTEYALRVWILKHRDDQDYYNTCKFSDLMPNFAQYCDLHYPADEEDPDNWYWGNFYLNEDDCETGYYDFVFTYEGKAIGVLLTRFYKVEELLGKSDEALEAIMKE
ncbi:MAG: hypothetical protein J6112_10395 [Clostridia bacterium]|nr:hypothetical protein [Clostridia bacterium]